jgi:hypothetical protein
MFSDSGILIPVRAYQNDNPSVNALDLPIYGISLILLSLIAGLLDPHAEQRASKTGTHVYTMFSSLVCGGRDPI